MALIQCRNCGKTISDKATKCPNCGEILNESIPEEDILLTCEECGGTIPSGAGVCPNCGCPIQLTEEAPQKVAVTAVDLPKMNQSVKKKAIVTVCLAITTIALFIIGQKLYKNKQAEETARLAEEVAATYNSNLLLASTSMLSGASDAESAGNLIKQVWYNSIYEEKDSKTDKYTRPNGYFVSDFNTALGNLFSDSDFLATTSAIKANQELVASIMKDLKNPPDGYEDAYDAIKDYYSAYTTFTNLVIDPSGSLQTFSSNFSTADSEVLNQYNAMKIYLD